jgi:hypothetical protein
MWEWGRACGHGRRYGWAKGSRGQSGSVRIGVWIYGKGHRGPEGVGGGRRGAGRAESSGKRGEIIALSTPSTGAPESTRLLLSLLPAYCTPSVPMLSHFTFIDARSSTTCRGEIQLIVGRKLSSEFAFDSNMVLPLAQSLTVFVTVTHG